MYDVICEGGSTWAVHQIFMQDRLILFERCPLAAKFTVGVFMGMKWPDNAIPLFVPPLCDCIPNSVLSENVW